MVTPRKSGISFMCLTAGLCNHSVLSCLTWRTKAFFLFGILLSLFLPIFISSLSVPSSSKALSSKTVGGLFLMLHLLFMVITCAWSLPPALLPPILTFHTACFGTPAVEQPCMFFLIPLNKQIHEAVWMRIFKDKTPMRMGDSTQKSPFFL